MSDQCIIHGCTNRKNQGIFIGDICLPCSNMLVSGDPKFGVTFVHKMRDRIEELEAKLAKAVEALEKISKYDHQKTAIDALKYQPIHHPVAAIDMLRESLAVIASTDMKAWVNNTLAEIKGEK